MRYPGGGSRHTRCGAGSLSGRLTASLPRLRSGIFRPVILMPKRMDWEDETGLQYILEHEFVHIRRFDVIFKLLLLAAVCVHWFDPLVWVMYVLANRDIELSCDETVVHHFGSGTRASYAKVLISMEETRSGFAPLCNHFSKNAMEERITAIMKTRKITVISLLLAAALVVGTVTVFATSANLEANMNDVETEVDSVSLMSYVDPDDGKTYYSFDEGTTFEPLTDEEFEARLPHAPTSSGGRMMSTRRGSRTKRCSSKASLARLTGSTVTNSPGPRRRSTRPSPCTRTFWQTSNGASCTPDPWTARTS